jgi:pimeloyl-ACP methyl ester carboxylesterase
MHPGMTIAKFAGDVYNTWPEGVFTINLGATRNIMGSTFLVCHGAWSAGWAWKKVHPLMAAAGHRLVTPTQTGVGERAHLANPSIDLETHIQDILNVIRYEDLRDIVLIGHSYGGMVATGVADRARNRITQLIYLDAFVPDDGQSLLDLNQPVRQRIQEFANAGGWQVPPNPIPPDTSEADVEWLTEFRNRLNVLRWRSSCAVASLRCRAVIFTRREPRPRTPFVRSPSAPNASQAGVTTNSMPVIRRTSPRRKH